MDDFKKLNKMQCFKEGGSVQREVNFTKRDRKNVEPSDKSQDKKLVKKAFAQHDKAKHGGSEPTEIKLKKGGRAKKDCGTVKKYQAGGTVENAYAAKKTKKDIKDIANTKRQKPAMLSDGKSVKKMADGRSTGSLEQAALLNALPGKVNDIERARMAARGKNAMKYLGPAQQSEFVKQGGMSITPTPTPTPTGSGMPITNGSVDAQNMPMKKGGRAKKMNTGGTCS